jgi:5'(3')-deoxyribonucleotidase
MSKKTIYVDMDGVITNLHGRMDEVLSSKFNDLYIISSYYYGEDRYKFKDQEKPPQEIHDECMRLASDTDFVRDIDMYPYTMEMLDLLSSYNKDVIIMTSPSVCKFDNHERWSTTFNGKLAWVQRFSLLTRFRLNGFIMVNDVKNKASYANNNCVLIDDLESNCSAYGNENSILFPAPWNSLGKYISTKEDIIEYVKFAIEAIR